MSIDNWLQLLGIFTTGVFSFLVWKATVKSNKLSKENFEFAKEIKQIEKTIQDNREWKYRRIYAHWIDTRINKMITALLKQIYEYDPDYIKDVPREIGLSNDTLAKYFTISEVTDILYVFELYNDYLKEHWLKTKEEFYTGHSDSEYELLRESSQTVYDILVGYRDSLNLQLHGNTPMEELMGDVKWKP
ncbi:MULTISPECIES: hypothetical protein [Bacillus]|uniref:hypothetical protein n=1 Tax=Bacillus TaxID=1386 RepID=UPI00119C90B0|nr:MULTISPECIES: hypothetical protein [Bacillus]MDN5389867.1 hypothetical protein [Bacillus sp. LB7]MEC1023810.1 hypothetical protein [Bacillus paralicheniformis]MEC1026614.1 hypothetical protein [Bacillus paralicheniformis]MEC1037076.1 hypothetical protein [Bacillus paralicheniformis]MEC1052387.1 hypothetical protein [Bacillus paralicheniformis]